MRPRYRVDIPLDYPEKPSCENFEYCGPLLSAYHYHPQINHTLNQPPPSKFFSYATFFLQKKPIPVIVMKPRHPCVRVTVIIIAPFLIFFSSFLSWLPSWAGQVSIKGGTDIYPKFREWCHSSGGDDNPHDMSAFATPPPQNLYCFGAFSNFQSLYYSTKQWPGFLLIHTYMTKFSF